MYYKANPDMNRTKKLILAMAPVEKVMESLRVISGEVEVDTSSLKQQDEFAQTVESCWTEFGPSPRYFKRLVFAFVNSSEKEGIVIESDILIGLVLRASLCKTVIPDGNESCYLSFQLPCKPHSLDKNVNNAELLRIRIFPYHNDVSLRLWEAGAALAEYFLDHPSILADKHVIELGAGVGLTGLAIAAGCHPSTVFLTDYTKVCLENLAHNVKMNQEWLSEYGFSKERLSQVGL